MGKIEILLLALGLFTAITFLYWKLTRAYGKKEYGSKAWQQWTTRTFYWQGALFFSGAFTVATIYLLKWGEVLSF